MNKHFRLWEWRTHQDVDVLILWWQYWQISVLSGRLNVLTSCRKVVCDGTNLINTCRLFCVWEQRLGMCGRPRLLGIWSKIKNFHNKIKMEIMRWDWNYEIIKTNYIFKLFMKQNTNWKADNFYNWQDNEIIFIIRTEIRLRNNSNILSINTYSINPLSQQTWKPTLIQFGKHVLSFHGTQSMVYSFQQYYFSSENNFPLFYFVY